MKNSLRLGLALAAGLVAVSAPENAALAEETEQQKATVLKTIADPTPTRHNFDGVAATSTPLEQILRGVSDFGLVTEAQVAAAHTKGVKAAEKLAERAKADAERKGLDATLKSQLEAGHNSNEDIILGFTIDALMGDVQAAEKAQVSNAIGSLVESIGSQPVVVGPGRTITQSNDANLNDGTMGFSGSTTDGDGTSTDVDPIDFNNPVVPNQPESHSYEAFVQYLSDLSRRKVVPAAALKALGDLDIEDAFRTLKFMEKDSEVQKEFMTLLGNAIAEQERNAVAKANEHGNIFRRFINRRKASTAVYYGANVVGLNLTFGNVEGTEDINLETLLETAQANVAGKTKGTGR